MKNYDTNQLHVKYMLDEQTSIKIRIISFIAIIAVVGWHSECGSSVEQWVIPWFTTWSVPWFFIVSGFFYIKTMESVSPIQFLYKKAKTLIVPYLIWCLAGWCMWQPPHTEWSLAVFGLSRSTFPSGNLPMWYIRALIIFMTAGLIIYSVRVHLSNRLLQFAIFAVFVGGTRSIFQCLGICVSPGSSVVYFLFGCALAWFRVRLNCFMTRRPKRVILCALLFAVALLIRSFFTSHLMLNVAIVFALLGIWFVMDVIGQPLLIKNIYGLTSGIYFIHDPIRRTFDKYYADRIYTMLSAWQLNTYYFVRILVIIAVAGLAVYIIKRHFPRVAEIAFGGR